MNIINQLFRRIKQNNKKQINQQQNQKLKIQKLVKSTKKKKTIKIKMKNQLVKSQQINYQALLFQINFYIKKYHNQKRINCLYRRQSFKYKRLVQFDKAKPKSDTPLSLIQLELFKYQKKKIINQLISQKEKMIKKYQFINKGRKSKTSKIKNKSIKNLIDKQELYYFKFIFILKCCHIPKQINFFYYRLSVKLVRLVKFAKLEPKPDAPSSPIQFQLLKYCRKIKNQFVNQKKNMKQQQMNNLINNKSKS
ncbi:hypothetical protein TTHERM_001302817 (macronuclear) [Tetrahymena thermophila SB210]|uniref:Uncharacterized protein n=1 Tax=Tetrahymena thermophila (strain SB210) TaxID=312017 RepID=W7XL36_TETTS|nr:hypothetical protein TTHERM_001302817 [Tetrahymena thermophila SB210]EWS75604.1 hypothetical protein TTHERM_001302817 [Tetrahymena thermophila SB210]|eukprot:XP_012651857.1 hypothetical protein TTHERM_001302817 [Tetrahymena thermophila SB210]